VQPQTPFIQGTFTYLADPHGNGNTISVWLKKTAQKVATVGNQLSAGG